MADDDVVEIQFYLVGHSKWEALTDRIIFDDYKSAKEYADNEGCGHDRVYWAAAIIDPNTLTEVD